MAAEFRAAKFESEINWRPVNTDTEYNPWQDLLLP